MCVSHMLMHEQAWNGMQFCSFRLYRTEAGALQWVGHASTTLAKTATMESMETLAGGLASPERSRADSEMLLLA